MTQFACDMTALTAEQRQRHQELAQALQSSLVGVRESDQGYEFEFPYNPATYMALMEVTPLEHACCPFFAISIVLEQTDRLCWRLTGSDGIKQFIRAEFHQWFLSGPGDGAGRS